MRTGLALIFAIALAGCVPVPGVPVPGRPPQGAALPAPTPQALTGTGLVDPGTAARNFVAVVGAMEPMVERECQTRNPSVGCDFQIVVDDRPGQGPNAFQTLDGQGRPVIAFTLGLISEARNRDELAFIMGHEAAHHILGHIPKTRDSAMVGALVLGTLASLGGGSEASVQAAQQMGANVGARRFSQGFELEADQLGTVIAWDAGYDPAIGAQFFDRLPDPGNSFLGTHPPNADRKAVVQATLAALRGY